MGKHLAPTPKHELNFITKKPTRNPESEDGAQRHARERLSETEEYLSEAVEIEDGDFSLESILAEVKGVNAEAAGESAGSAIEQTVLPTATAAEEQELHTSDSGVKTAESQAFAAPDSSAGAKGEEPVYAAAEENASEPVNAAPEDHFSQQEQENNAGPKTGDLPEETEETTSAPKKTNRIKSLKETAAKAGTLGKRWHLKFPRTAFGFKIAHPLVFLVSAVVLLCTVHFLPLEGWMVPAAFAVPALLALADPIMDAWTRISGGDWFCASGISCIAAILLFVIGAYMEAVLLLILTTAARLLEERLVGDCEKTHKRNLNILPEYATLVTDEGTERTEPSAVKVGDIILVAAGERIPLDGIITEGITTVDTASVSGQRAPWAVSTGYRVYSGCRNLTSDIKVRVTRPYAQSTVKKLVNLAESAPDFASGQEQYAARCIRFFVPAVLLLALIAAAVPLFRHPWASWLRRAAVLMIAARPVADSFGLPLLYWRSLVQAAKDGVFAKGKDCMEALAKAETMIFDKTGTITEGRYAVTDVYPVKMSEQQLLTIAATAESFSRHPIAAAIRESAGRIDEKIIRQIRIKEVPGRGVSALVGDRQLLVGNAALLEDNGVKYNIPARPGTAIHVSVDKRYCGYIIVADKVRRRAFDALETLRVNGIQKLVLLSGDVVSVARPVASRLNFDMLRAELTPDDKAKAVSYLMKNNGPHSTIALIGEGSNINRTMTDADVGIAMGALGSEMALACADILVMDRDIFKLPRMVALTRRAYRLAAENLYGGAVIQGLMVLFGALGILPPLAAEIISFGLGAALLANTLRLKTQGNSR